MFNENASDLQPFVRLAGPSAREYPASRANASGSLVAAGGGRGFGNPRKSPSAASLAGTQSGVAASSFVELASGFQPLRVARFVLTSSRLMTSSGCSPVTRKRFSGETGVKV